MLRRAKDERRRAEGVRRTASAGLLVAVGTGVGNVLAYGFNLVLSRGLGPGGYAELGTLLSVFLIGSVPGMAVQAVNARRLAVAADAPSAVRGELVRALRRRGLLVGVGVAAVFAALAPAVAALLPSVTVGGVAWTGVSLAANTVFASYLGIAQGTSRFVTMTALYLAAHSTRLAIGAAAASTLVSPTTVMAAQTAAWALAAGIGRLLLRDEARIDAAASQQEARVGEVAGRQEQVTVAAGRGGSVTEVAGSYAYVGEGAGRSEPAAEGVGGHHEQVAVGAEWQVGAAAGSQAEDGGAGGGGAAVGRVAGVGGRGVGGGGAGYLAEVLRAAGGLGGILLLTVLDTLLASRYLVGEDLGRYNTGGLIARAAFFAPSFVAMLAYPRLARAEERRRALTVSLVLTGGIGVVGVGLAAVGGNPLIGVAFGSEYASGGGFDLGGHGWLFAAVGALLALVNLALLDGVARRSHAVSVVVLGGIAVEAGIIVGFAHSSPAEIVTAAAASALVTASASVAVCLSARAVPEVAAVAAGEAIRITAAPDAARL
ncbi:MAG: hypothetical protein HOW97_41915 [Catenulispora sp.]|nr:hypothetical protein [Catenulispora sp.]